MKILNCVLNRRFTNTLIRLLDASDNSVINNFVIIEPNLGCDLVKYQERIILKNKEDIIDFISSNKYDVVVLHDLASFPLELITSIPQGIKVVWYAWGNDIYTDISGLPLIKLNNIYRSKTRICMRGGLLYQIRVLHGKLDTLSKCSLMKRAINRIDYFSGVIPEEYDMMCANKCFRAEKLNFTYAEPREISEVNGLDAFGDNILVGNSGDPTNNHIDAFEILKKVDIGDRKVISFLSYGGTSEYRHKVIEAGKKIWGEQFISYENFLEPKEYNRVLNSCGNVIMYHERQQAMGNIWNALWAGCRIFLSRTGVPYIHYKNKSAIVYTMEDLSESTLAAPLSNVEKDYNRRILMENAIPTPIQKVNNIYKILGERL